MQVSDDMQGMDCLKCKQAKFCWIQLLVMPNEAAYLPVATLTRNRKAMHASVRLSCLVNASHNPHSNRAQRCQCQT